MNIWKMDDETLIKAIKNPLALIKAIWDGNVDRVFAYVYDNIRGILGCSIMWIMT